MRFKTPFPPKEGAGASNRGLRNLYKRYLRSARDKNIYFDITLERFNALTKKLCAYCERPPLQRSGDYMYNGLDRVDNERGYTESNLSPCCQECNAIKSNRLAADEMRVVAQALKAYRARDK